MKTRHTSRRDFLKQATATVAMLPFPAIAQGAGGRVVVVGGGFAGATCARFIGRNDPRITVTLVAASPTFIACPFSNAVIAGLRELKAQEFGYDKLAADQIVLNITPAVAVDAAARAARPPFGLPLSFSQAGKTLIFTPVRESSGESGLSQGGDRLCGVGAAAAGALTARTRQGARPHQPLWKS